MAFEKACMTRNHWSSKWPISLSVCFSCFTNLFIHIYLCISSSANLSGRQDIIYCSFNLTLIHSAFQPVWLHQDMNLFYAVIEWSCECTACGCLLGTQRRAVCMCVCWYVNLCEGVCINVRLWVCVCTWTMFLHLLHVAGHSGCLQEKPICTLSLKPPLSEAIPVEFQSRPGHIGTDEEKLTETDRQIS